MGFRSLGAGAAGTQALLRVPHETQKALSEIEVWTGVKDGDEVHCSDWPKKAPGERVIGFEFDYSASYMEFSDEDMRRAVACVNACQYIPNNAIHIFVDRMKHALLMASELSTLRPSATSTRLIHHLTQSVELLNTAGYHWEKNS